MVHLRRRQLLQTLQQRRQPLKVQQLLELQQQQQQQQPRRLHLQLQLLLRLLLLPTLRFLRGLLFPLSPQQQQ
jgi:hypothetical protein